MRLRVHALHYSTSHTMPRLLIALSLLLTFAASAAGIPAPAPLRFTHFTTENGLPSNTVRGLAQDSLGFIWFATDGGLVRFDGQRCSVFSPSEPDGQQESYILSVCAAGDMLLAGTDRHLCLFDRRLERLVAADIGYRPADRRMGETPVGCIMYDTHGRIWVSTEGAGVYRLDRELSVRRHYVFPMADQSDIITYCDRHGIIWAVCNAHDGALFRLNPKTDRFEPFPLKIGTRTMNVPCSSIFEDTSGNHWLGTWSHGLLRFNPATGEAWQAVSSSTEGIRHIHSITQFSPSSLLIGSGSGLVVFDIRSGGYTVYSNDELDSMSLSNQFVYPVMRDREGGFWVGTFYGGVNYLAPDTKHIRTFRHSRFINSICGNLVSGICEDPSGDIWIGSDDGGLCRYSPATGLFSHYPLRRGEGRDNVHALCPDGQRLWVGTYCGGAGWLDTSSGAWHPVPLADGDTSYSSYAMTKGRDGRIWMVSFDALYAYDPSREVFAKVADLGVWVLDIEQDPDGRLWLASQGKGVLIYDPRSHTLSAIDRNTRPLAIPHNHVNDLFIDNEGNMLIGTVGGAAVYNRRDRKIRTLDARSPSGHVSSVTKVGDDIWLATTNGLVRLTKDGNAEHFDRHDGLSGSQFAASAALLASDGSLYLGTLNGLSVLRPLEVRLNSFVPPVMFTGLEIGSRPVEVGSDRLPEELNTVDKLVLTPDDHVFTVNFASLSYANPQCNRYRYRLEGFDKEWIDAGNRGSATYSNLPPGTYTLRVEASNNDGIWSGRAASLGIEMLPPWYATWWMKAVYMAMIVGAAYLLLRRERMRKERLYRKELERISDNKTKEVYRAKLKFFTIVAHEIRTPVSLIIGPLEKIMPVVAGSHPEVDEDLRVMERNSRRLLSLVNQMLDFKKVEESALPVDFRHQPVAPLVREVAERFRPSLQHKGIELLVDIADGKLEADICAESFTKLVSNLINNARKFTRSVVKVECGPTAGGDSFHIAVADDGIGIRKENLEKIFTPFYQIIDNVNESRGGTGLGLSIVKGIVETHHGGITVDSEPGKGSRFVATLPLRQPGQAGKRQPETSGIGVKAPAISKCVNAVPDSGRDTMLVVDDNEEMRRFIASRFSETFDVVTAADGRQALDVLATCRVSMIICDWMMPVMDGAEVLRAVRADSALSHIPFVMLTARTDSPSKIEGFKAGVDAYVEKPFSINVLEANVANILEMRRRLREKYSTMPLEPVATLAPNEQDSEFLKRMNDIIEENFSNPELTVDFLASRLGISRSGFYAKIKLLADVTPNEIIQITRLKKAAELLKENRYRISEISFMVGFNSSSYFSKCFQKQFGMTPGRFVEKQTSTAIHT